MLTALRRRREPRRIERAFPNPRSSSPKGRLRPIKQTTYRQLVVSEIVGRVLLLAAVVALGVIAYRFLAALETRPSLRLHRVHLDLALFLFARGNASLRDRSPSPCIVHGGLSRS